MMFAVVYLSSKLGQVAGQGLFAVIRKHYPRWLLYAALVGVLIGNTIEAGADLGGMAAALNLLVPIRLDGSSSQSRSRSSLFKCGARTTLIRDIFRWLALALLAYVGSAILAKPELLSVIKGTLIPHIQFNREFLSMLVAVIGTTLSAYLSTLGSPIKTWKKIFRWTPALERPARHDQGGFAPFRQRHCGRHDVLQPGHVLHHSFHGGDAV